MKRNMLSLLKEYIPLCYRQHLWKYALFILATFVAAALASPGIVIDFYVKIIDTIIMPMYYYMTADVQGVKIYQHIFPYIIAISLLLVLIFFLILLIIYIAGVLHAAYKNTKENLRQDNLFNKIYRTTDRILDAIAEGNHDLYHKLTVSAFRTALECMILVDPNNKGKEEGYIFNGFGEVLGGTKEPTDNIIKFGTETLLELYSYDEPPIVYRIYKSDNSVPFESIREFEVMFVIPIRVHSQGEYCYALFLSPRKDFLENIEFDRFVEAVSRILTICYIYSPAEVDKQEITT